MSSTHPRVWLNGEIVDAACARVSAMDAALLHGVGLFETMRAYNGRAFRLEQHLQRMALSAKALKLTFDIDVDRCRSAVQEVLDANGVAEARLRLTVTPGTAMLPGGEPEPIEPTILATATPVAAYPAAYCETGMTVLLSRYRQSAADPLCGHKTTCYWPRLLALREAHEAQCGEALWFTPENLLAEGSISNIFIVKDGSFKTPPIDTPILPGTVRGVILQAGEQDDRPVQEAPLTINDLLDADEIFLTNAVMEVMPVCRVERKPIGSGKPGPLTAWAHQAYRKAVAAG